MPPRAALIQGLVDHVGLTLAARLAMIATPVAAGVFSWLMTSYLDLRFAEARTACETVLERVVSVESAFQKSLDTLSTVDRRVTILETSTARGRADREQFQEQMVAELRELRATQSSVAVQLAAVVARIDALFDRTKQLTSQ